MASRAVLLRLIFVEPQYTPCVGASHVREHHFDPVARRQCADFITTPITREVRYSTLPCQGAIQTTVLLRTGNEWSLFSIK